MSEISKVAIIHPTFNYNGGAENLILWTIEEFNKIGIDYKIFTRTLRDNGSFNINQEYSNISLNPFIFKKEGKALLKKISDFDAVIIHNFPATIFWGYISREADKQKRKLPKSFWYCHEPSVRLYGHDEETFNKSSKTIDPIARYTMLLDRYGVSRIDKIFANSRRTAKHINRVYGREAVVIYPGIPKVNIKNKIYMNTEKKYFMYVGRIEKPKNIETAIEAFNIFLQTTKSYDTKFLIAGKGSDRKRLEEIVNKFGIENNVSFLGYISNEEKTNILSQSYAMILPAVYEPFGLTVIEAWTSGTIAILSEDTGVSEITKGAAAIIDMRNVKSLSDSMIEIFNNKEYRENMLEKSKEIIESGALFSDSYVRLLIENIKK